MVSGPAVLVSPGNSLEKQVLGPNFRPTVSETLRIGSPNLPPGDSDAHYCLRTPSWTVWLASMKAD